MHTQVPGTNIQRTSFFFPPRWVEIFLVIEHPGGPCKSSWSHILLHVTNSLHVDTLSSIMPPTQILVVTHPLACHLYIARRHVYFYHATHANSRGHTSSSLSPTHCTWTRLLLSCHPRKFSWSNLLQPAASKMRVDTLPSRMPPTHFTLRTHTSCLVPVPGAFPFVFVHQEPNFRRCVDKCQVNI